MLTPAHPFEGDLWYLAHIGAYKQTELSCMTRAGAAREQRKPYKYGLWHGRAAGKFTYLGSRQEPPTPRCLMCTTQARPSVHKHSSSSNQSGRIASTTRERRDGSQYAGER